MFSPISLVFAKDDNDKQNANNKDNTYFII